MPINPMRFLLDLPDPCGAELDEMDLLSLVHGTVAFDELLALTPAVERKSNEDILCQREFTELARLW